MYIHKRINIKFFKIKIKKDLFSKRKSLLTSSFNKKFFFLCEIKKFFLEIAPDHFPKTQPIISFNDI